MAINKLVARVEDEASASQAAPPQKRRNQGNPNWLPKQSLEQLLDVPCKIHSGAAPSTHTLRQLQRRTPAVARRGHAGSSGCTGGAPCTGSPSRSASATAASR
ncbi:hypothetical protein D1007_38560 [Hordeum vulgare]|nr:hypothetical protein D1007_38560 [Hordeum vulgare]